MQICTRSVAYVPKHAIGQRKAPFILLEHFRLNRQNFRRGAAYTFWRGRSHTVLPIVSAPLDLV
ncbi:hypothetical protein [Streptomyces sp. NPDC014622]|uniref:hypothetical protein n=1 Tax=Streptomyces sp. NPDC014622 TaxID=3364874 RepID=UPI0036F58C07